ncbi:MAG: hypothetical protein JNM17_01005 [Archangium sp.]|nr:hypothetical protein [Archangium sp.]
MTNCRSLVWVGVLLLAAPAWSQSAAERVDAARKLIETSKFKEAAAEVAAISRLENNPREVVIAQYELDGLSQAGLKKDAKALVAFQKLLTLEPNFKLAGKVPPKTAAVFKKAKQSVVQAGGGGIKSEQLSNEIKAGKVTAVYASVDNDLTQLAKNVRWHLRLDGGAWTVKEVPAQPVTNIEAGGKLVQWWLEVLGEGNSVLFVLGSEAQPLFDAVPGSAPPKTDPPKKDDGKKADATPPKKEDGKKPDAVAKKDAPVADTRPKLVPEEKVAAGPDVTSKPSGKGGFPIVPVAIGGVGVATAGVGVVFGVMSSGARNQITSAAPDPATGVVQTMTRAQALELEKQAQTNAVVANTMIGVGAALVVTGVAIAVIGAIGDK